MELLSAREIIDTLARGIHPLTGDAMPDDSPYNAPPVIRALFAASQALDHSLDARPRARPPAPHKAGKPWHEEDDALLLAGFAQGDEFAVLAEALGRTRFGIEQRLIKLGKIAPAGGGRYL